MSDQQAARPEARTPAHLLLDGVRVGRGVVLGMRFDEGVHVLFGEPEDGGAELAAVVCGLSPPRRGRVRVGGRDPFSDPSTRRRIASVLEVEPPLLGRTVAEHFARLHPSRVAEPLDALVARAPWLETLRDRASDSLDERERRAVAAALLFVEPRPDVVVLYEPLTLAPELEAGRLLERLSELAQAGSVVVCVTSNLRAARKLAGRIWSLSGRTLPLERHADLLVRSGDPRGLMSRLAGHPAVIALRFEEASPHDLWIRGNSPEPLCAATHDALLAERCELFEMTLARLSDGFFQGRDDS